MVALLAVGAFVTASSAAAATQHWAEGPPTQKSFSGSQSLTSQAVGQIRISWPFNGSQFSCSGLAASGSATNPANGTSGTLVAESWALEGCSVNVPNCVVGKEGSSGRIAFEPLKGVTSEEAGTDWIIFSPQSGSTAAVIHFQSREGQCPLGESVVVSGSFAAKAWPEQPGQYHIVPVPEHHLLIGTSSFNMEGDFQLLNGSKEALVLSSAETPGVPRWFTLSSEWNNLAAGKSTTYASSGAMSFSMHVKIALTEVEITCNGTANGIAGSVENPIGGGAGTATASFTLSQCSPTVNPKSSCTLKLPVKSAELSGIASELGGRPVLELSPREGTTVIKFPFSEKCSLGESIWVTGKLIATSLGHGEFNLESSELKVGTQTAATSGTFALKSASGQYLRLQP